MNDRQSMKETLKTMKYAIGMIYSIKKSVLFIVAFSSLLSALKPFVPIILSARILDELLGDQSIEMLVLYAGLLIGLSLILHVAGGWLQKFSRVRIIELNNIYYMKMAQKTMTIDYEYIEDTKIHDLRRLIDEGNNMQGGFWSFVRDFNHLLNALFEIIISTVIIVGLFSGGVVSGVAQKYAFIQSPYLAASLFIMMFLVTLVNAIVQSKNGKLEYRIMSEMMGLNRAGIYIGHRLVFDYEMGKDFRIYNAGDMLMARTRELMGKFREIINRLFFKPTTKYSIISNLFNSLLLGFVYLFVLLKAFIGAITIGSVMMQVGAIQRFYDGISSFVVSLTTLRVSTMYFSNSVRYLELPPRKYVGSLPVEKREDHEYDIEFRNVSFKYPGTDVFALKNINLSLTVGERLAVVGMNGAGKTTMIKLLCRLYDPTEGEILLNGVDIKKYDYDEYLTLFSVVFQDFKLFSFPIDENVSCSKEYDDERLGLVLDEAGIGTRVMEMPVKARTAVGKSFDDEGVDISGGEKQKLAIARALYKDASIIILDEPTAALDPISEFEIYSKFDHLVGNKTAIYISHRLSSCRFCHDIIVFHEGEIIQRGTHEDLLSHSEGKYAELWTSQAQYYQD